MIDLNSIVVILMAEALAALFLIILVFFLLSRKKSSGEQVAAHQLIDKLEGTKNFKTKKLGKMISDHCAIEQDELKELLREISHSERILYQNIIQVFLNKDTSLLKKIDQQIDGLSEPYCKILTRYSGNTAGVEKREVVENKISEQTQENMRLSEQLSAAMSTMDEISSEYTRVFSGTQTELELENSSKKMFTIFHEAEQRIRDSYKDTEAP
jgi:hypothetical protein